MFNLIIKSTRGHCLPLTPPDLFGQIDFNPTNAHQTDFDQINHTRPISRNYLMSLISNMPKYFLLPHMNGWVVELYILKITHNSVGKHVSQSNEAWMNPDAHKYFCRVLVPYTHMASAQQTQTSVPPLSMNLGGGGSLPFRLEMFAFYE